MSTFTCEVSQNAPLVCLPPWRENPYRLVSLWDMQFDAFKTLRALDLLTRIEASIELLGGTYINSPTFHNVCLENLHNLAVVLKELGLFSQERRAIQMASYVSKYDKEPELSEIKKLRLLIEHDIEQFSFEAIPRDRVPYYEAVHLFGDQVHDHFFSAAYDIREAGTCYSLGRWTACVFHLMRVLEIALAVMGKVFDVSLAHTNWAPAIDQMESRIREMHKDANWKSLPDVKNQQEFYAQVASHFGILKDAWRNYTAHARGKYDPSECLLILRNTDSFMRKLATRLHE